ncbi:MAG: HRDC domain-containing protein [Spirosomataceae bacterium]
MQIKLFTVSIGDEGSQQDELNAFLRGHKVLDVSQHIVQNERGAYWCFCVRYIEGTPAVTPTRNLQFKEKVDYKQVLDEATFKIFARMREIRKQIAADEAIPAFAIFTDEELSALAQLPELTAKTMQSVKGIGEKKTERYAERFLKALNT